MIPPELTAPPLRDPAAAPEVFARFRSDIRFGLLFALLGPPLFGLLLWLRQGRRESALVVLGALALGAYALHGAWTAWREMREVLPLYRRGVPTVGRVRRVDAPGDRAFSTPVRFEVEFEDGEGRARLAVVETIAPNGLVDRRTDVPVTVLYLPYDPTRVAMHTPALGLLAGTCAD